LFYEKNPEFYLGLKMSKDQKYVLLTGASKTGSKIWTLSVAERKLVKVW
jgi:protease II